MGDAYRDEQQAALAAMARLHDENAALRADLAAMEDRLGAVERRAGLRSPRAARRPAVVAAVAGAVVLVGAVAFLMTARSAPPPRLAVGPVGVAECDEYIAKWNACYKDPGMRRAAEPALQRVAESWRGMVHNPAQRDALASTCRQMVDTFPQTSCQ